MAVSKPLLTEFGIHQRLESCEQYPLPQWGIVQENRYLFVYIPCDRLFFPDNTNPVDIQTTTSGCEEGQSPTADEGSSGNRKRKTSRRISVGPAKAGNDVFEDNSRFDHSFLCFPLAFSGKRTSWICWRVSQWPHIEGDFVLVGSFQQLSCLSRGTLEGFLSWQDALQGLTASPVWVVATKLKCCLLCRNDDIPG